MSTGETTLVVSAHATTSSVPGNLATKASPDVAQPLPPLQTVWKAPGVVGKLVELVCPVT